MSTLRVTFLLLVAGILPSVAVAQVPPVRRLGLELETERDRISRERTSRQTEVARLERIVERLQDRVTLLERRLFGAAELPAITVAEADAVLRFARKRLAEDELRFDEGELAESLVEADRLAVVRAEAQLSIARAASKERATILDIELIDAQRSVGEEVRKLDQLRSLLAKGLGTTANFELQKLAVARAEKQLERVRIRAAMYKQIGARVAPAPPEEPAAAEEP